MKQKGVQIGRLVRERPPNCLVDVWEIDVPVSADLSRRDLWISGAK
jgi:hypothetical protein